MEIKISILIPAYKAQYLKEAIDSCLAQTYHYFELIIVDDASPYGLQSIIQNYSDRRIRYYKNKHNCGAENVVDNWNICLSYATGKYVMCIGDDDVLKPNCLGDYVKLINKYPGLGVYHAQTEIIDEKSHFTDMTISRGEYESVYSLIWHRWNGRKQFIGDFLYDTELLRSNGGFYKLPLAWGSDDITSYIAARAQGIANTQNICFCYRKNSSTISSSSNAILKMKAIMKEMDWYRVFLCVEPENRLDCQYRQCIIKQFSKHFDKKKGQTIALDLNKNSLYRIFYWLSKMKKYDLSIKVLLYAILLSIKEER